MCREAVIDRCHAGGVDGDYRRVCARLVYWPLRCGNVYPRLRLSFILTKGTTFGGYSRTLRTPAAVPNLEYEGTAPHPPFNINPANRLPPGKKSESADTPAADIAHVGEKSEPRKKFAHLGATYTNSVKDRQRVCGSDVLLVCESR
jgi:hypothetical protein